MAFQDFFETYLNILKAHLFCIYNDRIINGSRVTVSTNFDLNLNDSESVILLFALSLQNWYKLLNAFEYHAFE